MRILIVEDDPELRSMIRALLESLGHQADEATNRADALHMLTSDTELSVVMLDLGLPPDPYGPSEGLAFLEAAMARNSLLKVIVLTGQSDADATLKAIEFGAFDYLQKPFQREALAQAINRAEIFQAQHLRLSQQAKVALHIVADASSDSAVQRLKDEVMQRLLRTVLHDTGHNVSEAARRLNVTREHLYYYLNKHGIKRLAH